jgi:hypothetical protein
MISSSQLIRQPTTGMISSSVANSKKAALTRRLSSRNKLDGGKPSYDRNKLDIEATAI